MSKNSSKIKSQNAKVNFKKELISALVTIASMFALVPLWVILVYYSCTGDYAEKTPCIFESSLLVYGSLLGLGVLSYVVTRSLIYKVGRKI